MQRFPELFKRYSDNVTDPVDMGEKQTDLLEPLSSIYRVLYDSNDEVHKIQQSLSIDPCLEVIIHAEKVLHPAEDAVGRLLSINLYDDQLLHVGAKIADAGDKLDSIVADKISKSEKEFKDQIQHVLDWKPAFGRDRITRSRDNLRKILKDYQGFIEVSKGRGLDVHVQPNIIAYSTVIEAIKEIDHEFDQLLHEYRVVHNEDYLHSIKKKIDTKIRSGLRKGTLRKRCIEIGYKEKILDLDRLQNDMQYTADIFNEIINKRNLIQEDITRITKINLMQKEYSVDELRYILALKKYSQERHMNSSMFLQGHISKYMAISERLQDMVDSVLEYEQFILSKRYNSITGIKNVEPTLKKINTYQNSLETCEKASRDILQKVQVLGKDTSKVNGLIGYIADRKKEVQEAIQLRQRIIGNRIVFQTIYTELKQNGIDQKLISQLSEIKKIDIPELDLGYYRELKSESEKALQTYRQLVNYQMKMMDKLDPKRALKLYEQLNQYEDVSDRISSLVAIIRNSKQESELARKIKEQKKALDARSKHIGEIKNKVLTLEESLRKKDEQYWNNANPISDDVKYRARDGKLWDVRNFIESNDKRIIKTVEKNDLKGKDNDDSAYKCMKWVQDNITYRKDPQNTDNPEEWLFPHETLESKVGDCEDGTNLMISLMLAADIPSYKVKNACGEVVGGGHSWPMYLREKGDWVILDWCYEPSDMPIEERISAEENLKYKKIWFAFNDVHSWADDSYVVAKGYSPEEKIQDTLDKDQIKDLLQETLGEIVTKKHVKEWTLPSKPEDIEVSKFYHLTEVIENKIMQSCWEDKLGYMKKLVQNHIDKNEFVKGVDLKAVEHAYNLLDSKWKGGKIGMTPGCLKERMLIVDTLGAMHNYVERSRAIYGLI